MTDWQPIATAPTNGPTIRVGKLINGEVTNYASSYWFDGDLTAGWADLLGKPLGFEPTHWLPEPPRPEADEQPDG